MNHELKLIRIGQIVIAECSCGKWASRTAWKVEEGDRAAINRMTADHRSHFAGDEDTTITEPPAQGNGPVHSRPAASAEPVVRRRGPLARRRL